MVPRAMASLTVEAKAKKFRSIWEIKRLEIKLLALLIDTVTIIE